MNNHPPAVKMIDYFITLFMIIFLLSLTNSIFLNQLGYYGALLLIILRYIFTKQNQFNKSGIELALVFFIAVEILSAIFSEHSPAAFTNVLKRALLLPIIYVTAASVTDLNKGKLFFKIYIAASLVTVLIYLFFSYRHFIANQYGQTETGPSIFQYPITASEIMSFTVIYFFAFLINEKTTFKNKLFVLAAFLVSTAAVFSTYKRTGWLAVAFGVLIVLIIKKQWKIIIPLAAAGIIIFILQKNTSKVHIYSFDNNSIKYEQSFETEGQANAIHIENDSYFISDYENGLAEYSNSSMIKKTELPAPVTSLNHWGNNFYYAGLVDTRFILLEKKSESFEKKDEFLTRGIPASASVFNKKLFVLDPDSGLTIFNNPLDLTDTTYYTVFKGFTNILADSSFFILFIPPNRIDLFENQSGVPGNLITSFKNKKPVISIYLLGEQLLISDDDGTTVYSLKNFPVEKIHYPSLKEIYKWYKDDKGIYAVDLAGNFYSMMSSKDTLSILSKQQIDFLPKDFAVINNRLYIVELKKSRVASILDPYHPSNYGRFALWRAGWEIFKDYPIFGVGDIDLRDYYIKYKRNFDKEIQGHMHNNFIHVLVTLGIAGLLAVLFLFIKIILLELKIYYSVKDEPFISSYALGTIGGFSAFLFAGLTELNFGDHEIITLIWFTLGLNIAFYQKKIE